MRDVVFHMCRDHSVYGLSQWEKALLCNTFFHWPRPYPEWFLVCICMTSISPTWVCPALFSANRLLINYGFQTVQKIIPCRDHLLPSQYTALFATLRIGYQCLFSVSIDSPDHLFKTHWKYFNLNHSFEKVFQKVFFRLHVFFSINQQAYGADITLPSLFSLELLKRNTATFWTH